MVDEVEDEVITIEESAPEVDNSETVVEAPDAVVEASPTIIVETPPVEETVSDSEIDRAVETAERLTALEGVAGGLVNQVAELAYTVPQAQASADAAVDIAVEAVEEAQEVTEEVEDEAPSDTGPHWWFESRKDRKKRKGQH
jgi:hypothetical protein